MKPEKLIICGWGPYKEETVIDFEKMNSSGLFLVTGQTGAGKTTIFDAIAYALYGVLSGEVREKGSVRSDFADADTRTYVELYMRHKDEQYHISRNPEYQRPKKRKSGENAFTKEKENAVLTMPDGTIIAGNQDVTEKIEELLHMDGKQFRQISMIAQGEFSKMLFASPAEKNAIFRELFGTGVYAQIQSQLKNQSASLYREYMVFKNKMEEDVHLLTIQDEEWQTLTCKETFDFEEIEQYLAKKLEAEKEVVSGKKKEENELDAKLLSLQKEMESARQINARFKELDAAGRKLEELEKQKSKMEHLEEQIKATKKAQVLFQEEKILSEKEQSLTEVSERIKRLQTELAERKKQAEILEETAKNRESIESAFELAEQLQEMQKQQKNTERSYSRTGDQLKNARLAYEKAQETAEEKKRQYEEADVRYKKAVIGIAAKMVKPGEPCPVCGSVDHPNVAHVSQDIPDEKQLEAWKKEAEESQTKSNLHYEQALTLTNEEKRYAADLKECGLKIKELSEKLTGFDEAISAYIKEHTRQAFGQEITLYLESSTVIAEKEKQFAQSAAEYEQKQKEVTEKRRIFETKIAEAGFANRDAYDSVVRTLEQSENREKEYRTYQDSVTAAKNLKEHLQKALSDLSPQEEDVLQELFLQKQSELKECRRGLEEDNIRISQMTRSLQGIRKNRVHADKIKKEYGIVKDLDDLANGNNARRLVFEQFVLAAYFEKILQAANLRLTNMTDGRYELLRAEQVSDGRKKDNLEILVMDYYTGRKRSVKTLSGGETFKASLALALGLSDCIQAENGGTEIETLFIDEGFGALDEESLEQACITLQMLAGNNRMVGIISHVAQLRERIEHQIIVEKKNNGSCVKVL